MGWGLRIGADSTISSDGQSVIAAPTSHYIGADSAESEDRRLELEPVFRLKTADLNPVALQVCHDCDEPGK